MSVSSSHRPAPLTNERGIALVLTLLLTMAMSAFAAALMIMSQTETYGTMNYRMMSQARYGAESGVHMTVNYLLGSYVASQPGTAGDPLTNYDTTVSPVTYGGQPVVLSANAAVASNYPVTAVKTAFNAAAHGSLTAGKSTVNYASYATLLSMRAAGTSIVQTWQITSVGTMVGARPAQEEVQATLETPMVPGSGYAAFAISARCGAIAFSGGAATDSYDSSTYSGTGAITLANGGLLSSGGDVGTNGNLAESGSTTTINGALYTPRTGVGTCSNGGGGIASNALTQSGNATVTGGVSQLPQMVLPSAPTITTPSPAPPTTPVVISAATTCAALTLPSPATCSGVAANLVISPNGSSLSLGSLNVTGGATVTLNGGTYNFNSLASSGNSTVKMAGTVQMTLMTTINISGNSKIQIPDASSNLTMNIVTSASTSPVSMSGSAISNATMDPTRFQINYAGGNSDPTSAAAPNPVISLSGGTQAALLVNAPYAALNTSGSADLYGSFVAKTLTDSGGAKFHYDRNLTNSGYNAAPGNPVLTAFSWKRF